MASPSPIQAALDIHRGRSRALRPSSSISCARPPRPIIDPRRSIITGSDREPPNRPRAGPIAGAGPADESDDDLSDVGGA